MLHLASSNITLSAAIRTTSTLVSVFRAKHEGKPINCDLFQGAPNAAEYIPRMLCTLYDGGSGHALICILFSHVYQPL